MIAPEIQAEILALYFGQKKGTRYIARHLGIGRKAVRLIVSKRKVSMEREPGQRKSILDPYKTMIEGWLKQDPGIRTSMILQRLRECGYTGGYSVLKAWVAAQREIPHRAREAFLRIEFAPGETAQVDWGEFGDAFGDGIKIHCFVMVLCHSRLLYIEFTRSEKFEDFIRCHENAFKFFGDKVPRACWYDNLTSAVTERMGALIRFNARFLAYVGHHGILPHACNPARGNEKGRVEDGVKYIRSSFWEGRTFQDFSDLTRQAAGWRDQIANKREHRATRRVPILHFTADEVDKLLPMNPHSYDTRELFSRVVPPNFLVSYDSNKYSVPWTLVGLTLTVRVSDQEIQFYYHERRVATHPRCYLKHKVVASDAHSKGLLERKPGASRENWQIAAVKNIGPVMREYLDFLRAGNRSIRQEASRLLALATIYGDAQVNSACADLLRAGIVGVDTLELTLKRAHHPAEHILKPSPLQFQNTKLNRAVPTVDLRRYDALLFASSARDCHEETASASVNTDEKQKEDSNENDSKHPVKLIGFDEFDND